MSWPASTLLVVEIFSGLGQTKVIEDALKELRDRETREGHQQEVGGAEAVGGLEGGGSLGQPWPF
eukprot:3758546-Lingulodinium_polyedra.AAC.1